MCVGMLVKANYWDGEALVAGLVTGRGFVYTMFDKSKIRSDGLGQ